jgi:hypothetical protein
MGPGARKISMRVDYCYGGVRTENLIRELLCTKLSTNNDMFLLLLRATIVFDSALSTITLGVIRLPMQIVFIVKSCDSLYEISSMRIS